ncbi:MAG: 3-oxoacyl-ACP synthase III family protein [Brevundimonas sp.]
MTAGIEAIAYALGSDVLTNEMLAARYPEWDVARLEGKTGVVSRPIAAEGETALDLGERACLLLDERGQLQPETIDALIFCTETPDHPIPPNACVLHGRLKLRSAVIAFDITLACSGYTYGLLLARSLIAGGAARRVLLVTGDTYSRLIHDRDRATRSLFGDGAAATVVSAAAPGLRILDVEACTAGSQYHRFIVEAGGARTPKTEDTASEYTDRSGNIRTKENIEMDGLGVLSFFNSTIPGAVRTLLARHGLAVEDVDRFVFHQASHVALDGIRRALAIPPDRFVSNLSQTGNLVSASIPVALAQSLEADPLPAGAKVVLCGFGVGLSWATALVEV